MSEKIETELLDNFLIVWNPEQGSNLYRLGYYGKPLGIPKPKIPEFDVPLILDLMEGVYLVEKGKITGRAWIIYWPPPDVGLVDEVTYGFSEI